MGELIKICAWCNIDLDKLRNNNREFVEGEDSISHDLCKKCAKEHFDYSDEELQDIFSDIKEDDESLNNDSLSSYAGFIEDLIKKLTKNNVITYNQKKDFKRIPGIDVNKAYQIFSKIESNNSFAVGDSGTSFGKTQVQIGNFLKRISDIPDVENITGLNPSEMKSFAEEWEKQKKILSNTNWRRKVNVDKNEVFKFIKNNPKNIMRRREGIVVRVFPGGQPGVIRVINNKVLAEVLDLDVLRGLGFDTSSQNVMQKVRSIMSRFITWAVARNALARILAYQKMPNTHDKIMSVFSSRNVNNNPELLAITDKVVQADFINRVQSVVEAVNKYEYDTGAPGAYNIYQLVGIANAGGVGAVIQFLKNQNPFSSGYLTYLNKGNPEIQRVTGIQTQMPPGGGLSGFTAKANLYKTIVKKSSLVGSDFLSFPDQYIDDIKSGKRKITIRSEDVPFEVPDIIKCMSYSGSHVCDLRINAKNLMSINRIRKAYGKKMAESLERKFGPKGQFTVIRFEPWDINFEKNMESNAYDYGILNINTTGDPFGESGAIYPASNISSEGIEPYSYAKDKLYNIWKIADSIGSGGALERKKKEEDDVRKFLEEHGGKFGEDGGLVEELLPNKKRKLKRQMEPSLFDEEKLQKGEKEKRKKERMERPLDTSWYEKENLKTLKPVKKFDLPKKPPSFKKYPDVGFEGLKEIEKKDIGLDNFGLEQEIVKEQSDVKEDDLIILTPSQICDVEGEWVISCEEVYENRHLYDEISIDDIFKKHKKVESDVSPELLNVEKKEVVYKEPSVSKETLEKEVKEPELTNSEIEKIQENINPNSDNIVQRLSKDTNPDAIRLINSNPSIALDPTDEQYVDDKDDDLSNVENSGLSEDDDFDLEKIMEETISEVKIKKQLRYGGDLLITPFKIIKSSDGYEKHINLDEWPQKIDSVEKMKENGVSGEVVSYFTPEALSSGGKMRKLFLEDKAWEILKKHPSSVQTYILPYLIGSLGKAWFDNNKDKSTFGNSPFGLWGVGEEAKQFVSLLLKDGISFEDSLKGKVIISKINETITKYANNYFSKFTSTLPIDKYIYGYLDKEMYRWVAYMYDFEEKKLIICSVCRKERFENGIDAAMKRESSVEAEPEFGKMEKLYEKSKVGLWECANCKNRVENVSYEINIIDEKIKQTKNKIFDIRSESMYYGVDELPNLNIELKDLKESKLHLEQSKNKYINQLRIPRMHTWCPNEECPGQRIPLTSIDWLDDFWKTKESKEVSLKLNLQYGIEIPKHVGLQLKIQNDDDDDYIYKNTNKHKHIPDSWMLNVPFICPHDGVKFTLESAKNKGTFGKGGHLWDPWQKSIWKPIGDAMKTSFEDSGIDIEEKNIVEGALDNKKIADLARKILIIKYWDERHSFLESTSETYNSFESALKNKSIMGKFRNLALYDSILNFSSHDSVAYSGWLCNKEIIKQQQMLGNNIGETRILDKKKKKDEGKSKDKKIKEDAREEVFVPVLQKWIDVMLSRGKNWREGFDQYNLSSWLVNEKKHGIRSQWPDTVGVFFVSKVKNGRFEFVLQDKFYKGKSKESKDLRLVKILNVFKIKEDRLGNLTSEELNGISDIKEEEKINSIVEDFTENLSSLVINYDFSGGNIETNSSIVSGDYILIHGLVISGKYDHPAITAIREVRSDNNDKKLFEQLGQLITNDIDNPKIWNDVKRLSSLKETMLEEDFKNQLESLRKKVEEEIKFRKEDQVEEEDQLEAYSDYKPLSKFAKDLLKKYKNKRDFFEISKLKGKIEIKKQT